MVHPIAKTDSAVVVRQARAEDAEQIHELIDQFANQDVMLHRSTEEILENLGDYSVASDGDEVVGCCAAHVCTPGLAEIKSLAVSPRYHGHGLGRRLVLACEENARAQGIPKLFCLTYVPDFFAKLGYHLVEKASLPHKVWTECFHCRKFPICGEEAMVKRFDGRVEPPISIIRQGPDGVPEALLRIMASSGRPGTES